MKVLVTGAAGFIGFHLIKKLIEQGHEVVGIDSINDYYSVDLKYARLDECGIHRNMVYADSIILSDCYPNYHFVMADLIDYPLLNSLFEKFRFDVVINMAAQAGVRYSINHPQSYIQSNVVGFTNLLECCRHHRIKHLLYASSSSVYGINNKIPFSEDDNVDYPISLYAATKKSNELLAHTYGHLFGLPTTGVRLFTVYGPWGRPDMAPMLFANAISKGETIQVYNQGNMLRDFTFVGDTVNAIIKLIDEIPGPEDEHPYYRIFNIGNSKPVQLMDFLAILEKAIGKQAIIEMKPIQPGDVPVTYADTTRLRNCIHYKPSTTLEEGIPVFIDWYRAYYFNDI